LIQGSTKGRQFINQEGQYKYKNIITIVLKLNSELTWVNVRIKIAIVIILKSYSRDNARKTSGHSSRWSTQLTLLFLKIIESTLFWSICFSKKSKGFLTIFYHVLTRVSDKVRLSQLFLYLFFKPGQVQVSSHHIMSAIIL
jgi:hypothetical protein